MPEGILLSDRKLVKMQRLDIINHYDNLIDTIDLANEKLGNHSEELISYIVSLKRANLNDMTLTLPYLFLGSEENRLNILFVTELLTSDEERLIQAVFSAPVNYYTKQMPKKEMHELSMSDFGDKGGSDNKFCAAFDDRQPQRVFRKGDHFSWSIFIKKKCQLFCGLAMYYDNGLFIDLNKDIWSGLEYVLLIVKSISSFEKQLANFSRLKDLWLVVPLENVGSVYKMVDESGLNNVAITSTRWSLQKFYDPALLKFESQATRKLRLILRLRDPQLISTRQDLQKLLDSNWVNLTGLSVTSSLPEFEIDTRTFSNLHNLETLTLKFFSLGSSCFSALPKLKDLTLLNFFSAKDDSLKGLNRNVNVHCKYCYRRACLPQFDTDIDFYKVKIYKVVSNRTYLSYNVRGNLDSFKKIYANILHRIKFNLFSNAQLLWFVYGGKHFKELIQRLNEQSSFLQFAQKVEDLTFVNYMTSPSKIEVKFESPVLKKIYINIKNLEYISPSSLENLPNLESLSIFGNLETLPNLHLPRLKNLDFGTKTTMRISDQCFQDCQSLKLIKLIGYTKAFEEDRNRRFMADESYSIIVDLCVYKIISTFSLKSKVQVQVLKKYTQHNHDFKIYLSSIDKVFIFE